MARELAPLRDKPEHLAEVWTEVVEDHGSAPTAAETRAVVEEKRGSLAVHYSSKTDDWATPQDMFDELDEEFGFELGKLGSA